jgi:hypothetical protein
MNHATPHSGRRGLFSWAPPDGIVTTDETLTNPLDIPCPWPACRALAGVACTTLSRRRPPHPSRKEAAQTAAVNRRKSS